MTDRLFLGHTTGIPRASITRPSNTTAYTAGDVIGTAALSMLTLDAMARSAGGKGMIADLYVIDSANQATKPTLEVWLFKAALEGAAVVDNAAFAPTDADLANLVGVVTLDTSFVGNATAGAGGNCVLRPSIPPLLPFACAANSDDLHAYIVVRNAYTPVADEIFTIVAGVLQDY